MLEGVMLLWFLLTGLSVLYVAIDVQSTPAAPVLKWGFVLLTAYTGPLGAFLYVLGCREPLSGLHERYVAIRWRQVLGSTMHCVAGDGVGILVGSVIASVMQLAGVLDLTLEYVLGFGFGWTIFQALAMRGAGSYKAALRKTFFPELLSMNMLMAGMVPTMMLAMMHLPGARDPAGPTFWFVMSMALLVGFVMAYPMNWWLVSRHLKHGMLTVGPSAGPENHEAHDGMPAMGGKSPDTAAPAAHAETGQVSRRALAGMTLLSFLLFAVGLGIAAYLGGFS
jgi:hypothetical protein